MISLAACLGVAVLWARRALWTDAVAFCTPGGQWQAAASTRHGLLVFVSEVPAGREWGGVVRAVTLASDDFEEPYGILFDPTAVRNSLAGFKLAGGTLTIGSQTPAYHAVLVPHWALVVPLAVPPLLWARGRLRRRRWARQGRCRHCGYDLRGSPERCPECGRPVGGAAATVAEKSERSDSNAAEAEETDRGSRLRRGGLKVGIALGVVAIVLGGLAVLNRAGRGVADDGRYVVGVYDAGDLAEPRGLVISKAVDVIERPEDLPDPNLDVWQYPFVIDRRPERLRGLASGADVLPASDAVGGPPKVKVGKGYTSARHWTSGVLGDQIVLVSPAAVHADYARLLGALRAPAGAAFLTVLAGEAAPAATPGVQDAEAKLAEILPEVWLDGVTLEAAFEQIRNTARANIVVDWAALDGCGVDRSAPVKLRLWDLPLSRVLAVLLAAVEPRDMPLGFRAGDGVIRVTTADALANSGVTMRIYDVRPLIEHAIAVKRALAASTGASTADQPILGGQGGGRSQTSDPEEDGEHYSFDEEMENLATYIRETVDPDSWRDNGGSTGMMREWAGRLIVQHTPEGHRRVEAALKLLSDSAKK
jgi:hypothetical protein